jgi:Ca2+/H+ antiporter
MHLDVCHHIRQFEQRKLSVALRYWLFICRMQVLGTAVNAIGISASFAGITIIAWMPSAMEIVNAVTFAHRNNIALAIEIGTSASVQYDVFLFFSVVFHCVRLTLVASGSP